MKKLWIAALALLIVTPLVAGEYRSADRPAGNGKYIVTFEKAAVATVGRQVGKDIAVSSLAHQLAAHSRAHVERVFEHALQGAVLRLPNEKAARALARNPNVAIVEEDGVFTVVATQNNPTWGLDRIDQRDRPLDSSYTYDTTASNVHAYVVDTGIRASHNEFGGRVSGGFTAINDGRGTGDCNGHGTHVAGTVGGSIYGVAKAIQLHPVRVLDCNGSGTTAGVIAGVDWVTSNHVKPAVANMSLGGGASSTLDNAVSNSIAAGVTYAVAAGNDNANACNFSPARVASALTVGSTTSSDSRSSFSNWGTCVDVFAPGSSITSAWYTSNTATNTISGTSMASPHVAGVAALYLAGNTGASPATVNQAIVDSATSGRLSSIGSGSPNLLLYSLLDDDGGGGGGGDDTELTNGQSVTVSGADGSQKFFFIEVPSGATDLVISITGGSGDADLYVRHGSKPTLSSYDCRPYRWGNEETCSSASPSAGTWWIMLHGYDAYSGVTLTASYTDPDGGGGGCSGDLYTGTLTGSGDYEYEPNGTYYFSGSGTHSGVMDGPSGTDFDLYLWKWNGSSWSTVAQSISSTSHEEISYSGTSGYYVWRVYSYSGSGDYTLCLNVPGRVASSRAGAGPPGIGISWQRSRGRSVSWIRERDLDGAVRGLIPAAPVGTTEHVQQLTNRHLLRFQGHLHFREPLRGGDLEAAHPLAGREDFPEAGISEAHGDLLVQARRLPGALGGAGSLPTHECHTPLGGAEAGAAPQALAQGLKSRPGSHVPQGHGHL